MLVFLRWLIIPAWVLAAVAATMFLPGFGAARTGGTSGIISAQAAPFHALAQSVSDFGYPLEADAAIVDYQAHGLSPQVQAHIAALSAMIDRHRLPGQGRIKGAAPLFDTGHVVPGSRGPARGTTAITYLFFDPSIAPADAQRDIDRVAERYLKGPGDGYVGATGFLPAENVQASAVNRSLKVVELSAIGVVLLVIALGFRSLVAPLVTLAAVGLAYVISLRVLAGAALALGFALPSELEPLIVILVVGIVTDYSVFFLFANRDFYGRGYDSKGAARHAGAEVIPLVLVAGTTVAAGTACLRLARLNLYGDLGPGMAIAALVAFIVAVTFLPAIMAVVGRSLYWPFDHPRRDRRERNSPARRRVRTRLARIGTRRLVAAPLLLLAVAGLVAAAAPLRHLDLGLNLVGDLGSHSGPARASAAAAKGFAPGIVAPTTVLVTGSDLPKPGLNRLQAELASQPGVAGAIGPANLPRQFHLGVFVDKTGNAARYAVILDHPPFGAQAVRAVRSLSRRLPALAAAAGLGHSRVQVAGYSAISASLSSQTRQSVTAVTGAILLVDLFMLVLLLRCLVAPLCLLAASALSVAASLGITVLVFQPVGAGLTFYVPMAVGVLLISFGSDYNIFLVGRIWEEGASRPIRGAIVAAVPGASATITRAGMALALTFALLAIVPIQAFRTFAFGMVVGIMVDTFVVRSVIVPAALALLGRWSAWPHRRLMRDLAGGSPGASTNVE
jgi:RND superfamily putative drug exporter